MHGHQNALDLTGSVAVITDGSRGIGFESAVALGLRGAKVVLAARDRSVLDAAVDRLASSGIHAASVVLDVTDPTAVTKAADAIVAEHGKVDILINNAGIVRLNAAVERPTTNGARYSTSTSMARSGAAERSGAT